MAKKSSKEKVDEQKSTELITDERTSGPFSSKIFQIALFVIVVVAIGAAIFFYSAYQQEQKKAKTLTGQASAEQVKDIISSVGKLMELPQNEAPTVATVSDIKKLADQPFFAGAKNGDRVLIYTTAGKAILYRPEINKIINVAPINAATTDSLSTPTASSSALNAQEAPATEKPLKVAILNGTKKSGLTRTGEGAIKDGGVNIEVTTRGNAGDDYQSTLVVDLSGSNGPITEKIAGILGGKTDVLPKGEEKPTDAQILIILGADFAK